MVELPQNPETAGQVSDPAVLTPAFEAGVFLVDKPVGPSSFRMVQLVRRALSIKKVGHAGTLDPFASGLLVICAGRAATRLISGFMDGDKVYEAVLKLGIATDSQDLEGRVLLTRSVPSLTKETAEACLAPFRGEQLQVPPQFSALKHKGKPLYHYARKGVIIEKEPRTIVIHELTLLALTPETMRIRVRCSKGTYIRTLAADIGEALGCGAHLIELRRLASGFFSVEDAIDGGLLTEREQARALLLARMLTVSRVQALLAASSSDLEPAG